MVNLSDTDFGGGCLDPMIASAKQVRKVARGGSAVRRSDTLARIIEADIIPRLLLANGGGTSAAPSAALLVDDQDIDAFAAMMMRLDIAQANIVIAGALSRGVTIETILLDLLAPTATRLGVLWEEDRCTFTDVTTGICALQNLLRAYASGEGVGPTAPLADSSALLTALPGEQHTFGVLMLETFFRRSGWDVVGMPLATHDEILGAAARRPFAIAGFSVSRESQLDTLRDMIGRVRTKSCNRNITILVGGRVFNENPGLYRNVGADMTAEDAQQAVIASQQHLWSTVRAH